MSTTAQVLSPVMADGTLYIVNIDFDGGRTGEIIKADPVLVADWVDAQFISEVDDRGDRIVRGDTIGGDGGITPDPERPKVEPARTVTAEDVDRAGADTDAA